MTSSPGASAWDPDLYERFKAERSQPFYDLAALVEARPGMRVLDLGCGSGELTAWLHGRLEAAETLGIDSSEAMLAAARAHEGGGVRFEYGDIAEFASDEHFDLVFANASLQWVAGHEKLFPRLARLLRPGGQLAVHVPANDDAPSHVLARELAAEPPYASALDGYNRVLYQLSPTRYSELLYALGFEEQYVRLQVYPHVLPGPEALVDWAEGSFLTPYRERLSPELYASFLRDYRARVLATAGDARPYFYPFARILMWGRLPETG